jgi:hypothetical protein
MSSRMAMLEARRQALLNRCEEQRLELSYHLAQLKPRDALTAWTRRSTGVAAKSPLAWAAGIAGLLLMLRRRKGIPGVGSVGLITGLVALTTRATTLMRVFVQLRAVYRGFRAAQRM